MFLENNRDKPVLVMEQNPLYSSIYRNTLNRFGKNIIIAPGRRAALYLLKKQSPEIVFIEIQIDGSPKEGLLFIEQAIMERPNLALVVISSIDDPNTIEAALKLGVIDYLIKQNSSHAEIEFKIGNLIKELESEICLTENVLRNEGLRIGSGQNIVGKSHLMLPVYRTIRRVAEDKSTVLVLGGSGTGKELVAKAIHAGKTGRSPFVSIDCGCIQKTLLESELFGVVANYPGMHNKERLMGQFEAAGAGTLLLDEIGNMPVDLQASLLRVLQEREFRPVGAEKPLSLHAQIVATTNSNLDDAISVGQFREDLYHRLNVIRIVLPDLKQRREDIPLLVDYCLKQHESRLGFRANILPEAMKKLIEYDWPGNVRELFQTLHRALTIHRSSHLAPHHFDFCLFSNESEDLRSINTKRTFFGERSNRLGGIDLELLGRYELVGRRSFGISKNMVCNRERAIPLLWKEVERNDLRIVEPFSLRVIYKQIWEPLMLPNQSRKSDQPIWEPLKHVIGERYLPDFMFMGKKCIGERSVFLYKHIFTRCYLNLDEAGRTYRYQESTYTPVDLTEALVHAFGTADIPRIAEHYKAAIDVVDLSQIYKYAGQVRLYFVVIDPDVSLWVLASVCASGKVDQLNEWVEKGQLLILNQPQLIPGLSDTPVETLRTEEAYLIKPALNEFLLEVRKSATGVLILRIFNKSLPAFLKPGIDAIFISENADFDETVQFLRKGTPTPVTPLPVNEGAETILRRLSLENLQGTDTEIAMFPGHIICKSSRCSNFNKRASGGIE